MCKHIMIMIIVYIYTRVRAGSTAVHIPLIQFLGTKAHLYTVTGKKRPP